MSKVRVFKYVGRSKTGGEVYYVDKDFDEEEDKDWVTLDPSGTHVYLDGKGEITAGPSGLTGHKPEDIPDKPKPDKPKPNKPKPEKPANKPKPEPKPEKPPEKPAEQPSAPKPKPAEQPAAGAPKPTAPAPGQVKPGATPGGFPPNEQPRQRPPQEMKEKGDQLWKHTGSQLDEDQESAIRSFTGNDYREINAEMRAGKTDGKHGQTIQILNEAFSQAPMMPPPAPPTTYRGLALSPDQFKAFQSQFNEAYKSGGTIEFQGFASTSLSYATASDFSKGEKHAVVMEIVAKKGIYTSPLSKFDEKEFTLGHGSKFRVKGMKTVVTYPAGKGKPAETKRVMQLEQVA